MRNKAGLKELLLFLGHHNISARFPNLDNEIPQQDMTEKTMQKLQNDHFRAIRDSEIIYIYNPDGYIGRMVGIEIGYAKALGKTIIFSSRTGQIELDVLADNILEKEDLLKDGQFRSLGK